MGHVPYPFNTPDEPKDRRTMFDPEFASTHLWAWLGDMSSTATQIMVEVDGLCYVVNGVRHDPDVGVELLLDPLGFFRDEDDEDDAIA